MALVRVHNMSVSLDGYATGEGQSLDAPFGHAGTRLHRVVLRDPRVFQAMHGKAGGRTGAWTTRWPRPWDQGIGAEIMGRRKFGPQQGPWSADLAWEGWWGQDPPFHTPVFVLTHHSCAQCSRCRAAPPSTSSTPNPPRRMPPGPRGRTAGSTCGSAAARATVRALPGRGPDRPSARGDRADPARPRRLRLWDGMEALEQRFPSIESVSTPAGVTHVTFTRR